MPKRLTDAPIARAVLRAIGHPAAGPAARPLTRPARRRGVLCVGRRGGDLEKPAAWIAGRNLPVQWTRTLGEVESLLQGARPSHLFIGIDDLGDLPTCVDDLLALRKTAPDVAVILFSQAFKTDDFDLGRLVLGDVSLRAPVNFRSLAMAMQVSEAHNRIWQGRSLT